MEVGPVTLGEAPNFVQEMRRLFETGTVSNSFYKPLKTGTDTQTYLNKLSVENPTPNENKTNAFKVKQLTPNHNKTTKLVVDDSAPNKTVFGD